MYRSLKPGETRRSGPERTPGPSLTRGVRALECADLNPCDPCMPVPLLCIKEVTKRFAGVRALSGVSLEIQPGEVHALVGENGAGKSTLIKIITGALLPDTGAIEIQGRPVLHLTPTRARALGVACVYQHPALFPDLTVSENIAIRLEKSAPFKPVRWRAYSELTGALLKSIGAEISPKAFIRDLSMPEKQ